MNFSLVFRIPPKVGVRPIPFQHKLQLLVSHFFWREMCDVICSLPIDTNDYVEQFLFCRPLSKNTTEIFKKVNSFFKEQQLEWSNCVPVCADGAPSMMESKRGFMSFAKRQNNDISVVHCLLHRVNLTAKEI